MENSIVNQKTKSSNIEAFIFLGILLLDFLMWQILWALV